MDRINVSKNVLEEVRFSPSNLADLGEDLGLRGIVHALLQGPDGEIKQETIQRNLITYIGDRYFAERAAGTASPPAQVTGMKLGTGVTAVAKTGAGAALVTYLAATQVAISGGYPSVIDQGTGRRVQWQGSWAAGVGTNAALAEAVIVNDVLADATTAAANTIARVLLSPTINKGANDTLTISWNMDVDIA